MNAPGKTFLKVAGILYIIEAVICFIGALCALVFGSALEAALGSGVGSMLGGVLGVALVIGGAIVLAVGILGVKNADKPEKAQTCFVIGLILLILSILSAISTLMKGISLMAIVSIVISVGIPAAYFYGALANKKSLTEM